MAATPISCCAGYTAICEIEKRNACQVAGKMADRLVHGLQALIKKYDLPFVCFNQALYATWIPLVPCTLRWTGSIRGPFRTP